MILVLIVILTIMSVALRISIAGVELSYQVGRRVNDIRRQGEKKLISNQNNYIKGLSKVTSSTINVSMRTVSIGAKSALRILRMVVTTLRNLLCSVLGLVLILDILVFLIIVAIAGAYVLFLQQ